MVFCFYCFHHGELAKRRLGGPDPELAAEKAGWVRVTSPSPRGSRRNCVMCSSKLTQAQADALFDLCEKHGVDYEALVRDDELEVE